MIELIIWLAVFVVSLAALVKAADWLAAGAQRVAGGGVEPSFAAASIAVALPELALSLAAVTFGRPDLVIPLVIGSSIANILLVVGVSALAAKNLPVKKEHIDLDAPLLAAIVAIFYLIVYDGDVNSLEGLLMVAIFFVYTFYIFSCANRRGLSPRDIITPENLALNGQKLVESVGARFDHGFDNIRNGGKGGFAKALLLSLAGAAILVAAANIAVESLVNIADILFVPAALLAISVLAAGVSLPELFSSLKTIGRKRYEVTLGNIFASNAINLMVVCGIAALFAPLPAKGLELTIGLPFLAASAGLLIISSFSRKINFGEGIMFLFLYLLFFVKLFGLF